MKSNSKRAEQIRQALKDMPELKHSFEGEQYDVGRSEVVRYMIELPEIQQWIFDEATHIGAIVFDGESRTWRGSEM